MKQKNGGLKKKRGRNAEKNNFNHPDSGNSGSGDVVQLRLSAADGYQSNHSHSSAGVASEFNLGVGIMVVAGAVLALAGVVFLLVCCLVVGS